MSVVGESVWKRGRRDTAAAEDEVSEGSDEKLVLLSGHVFRLELVEQLLDCGVRHDAERYA